MNISEPHLRRVHALSEEAPPDSGSTREYAHVNEQSALAGALHEVSNALTVVLGWLATVRSEPLEPHVRQAIDVAEQHARRGHHVARTAIGASTSAGTTGPSVTVDKADVEPASDMQRSESWHAGAGKSDASSPEQRETIVRSVSALVQDVLTAVRPAASAKAVQLIAKPALIGGFAGDLMVANADELLQVLVNLMLNAVAFSPKRGVVSLGTTVGDGQVVFGVADQGPGVPSGQQQRLFERGHSMRPGGAGIGLSHSQSLATQNGGSLSLASNHGGATFEVSWPTRELPSQTISKVPFLQGTKVLVLEDDEAVMEMVRFGLESRGAQVFHAANLAEIGVLTAVHRDFTLALLDLSPMNGAFAFAMQELRRSQAALPLILMSGSVNARLAELDTAAWVKKPFELSELYDTIQSVLSAKRS